MISKSVPHLPSARKAPPHPTPAPGRAPPTPLPGAAGGGGLDSWPSWPGWVCFGGSTAVGPHGVGPICVPFHSLSAYLGLWNRLDSVDLVSSSAAVGPGPGGCRARGRAPQIPRCAGHARRGDKERTGTPSSVPAGGVVVTRKRQGTGKVLWDSN